LKVHEGFLGLAREVLDKIRESITVDRHPGCKVIFVGHSIGGTLATLMTLLLAEEMGGEWVTENVANVCTCKSEASLYIDMWKRASEAAIRELVAQTDRFGTCN